MVQDPVHMKSALNKQLSITYVIEYQYVQYFSAFDIGSCCEVWFEAISGSLHVRLHKAQ